MPRVFRRQQPICGSGSSSCYDSTKKGPASLRLARQHMAYYVCYAMQITVNGNPQMIPDGLTVRALLDHLGMTEGPVAVERNRDVVPRSQHAAVAIEDNDVLEIVHFVGGG